MSIYDLSFLPNVKVSSIFDSKNEDNKLLIKNVPKTFMLKTYWKSTMSKLLFWKAMQLR